MVELWETIAVPAGAVSMSTSGNLESASIFFKVLGEGDTEDAAYSGRRAGSWELTPMLVKEIADTSAAKAGGAEPPEPSLGLGLQGERTGHGLADLGKMKESNGKGSDGGVEREGGWGVGMNASVSGEGGVSRSEGQGCVARRVLHAVVFASRGLHAHIQVVPCEEARDRRETQTCAAKDIAAADANSMSVDMSFGREEAGDAAGGQQVWHERALDVALHSRRGVVMHMLLSTEHTRAPASRERDGRGDRVETAFGGVYLDHHVPDGAVICLVSAAPAPADIGLVRLWGDAVARCCASTLMWRQPGAVSEAGATYVQHVEHGGGVLATDAGGQIYLLAHQTPAQLDDAAATHFLMVGQNVRAVCDVALGGRCWVLRARRPSAQRSLLAAERIQGLREGPATQKLFLLQAAMLQHECCRPLLAGVCRHASSSQSSPHRRDDPLTPGASTSLDGDLLALFLELQIHQQEALCASHGMQAAEVSQYIDALLHLTT